MRINENWPMTLFFLERVLCNESGGVQDQIAASFGGMNRINFNAEGYTVNPVIISPER